MSNPEQRACSWTPSLTENLVIPFPPPDGEEEEEALDERSLREQAKSLSHPCMALAAEGTRSEHPLPNGTVAGTRDELPPLLSPKKPCSSSRYK